MDQLSISISGSAGSWLDWLVIFVFGLGISSCPALWATAHWASFLWAISLWATDLWIAALFGQLGDHILL